jgi:hypothetical protein
MIAGALELQLTADVARLVRDMDKAKQVVGGAMSSITSAANVAARALGLLGAGLSVGALVSYIKTVIDAADGLNKLSQRTGIAVESLSQLRYAAKLADVSSDSLNTAIKKLNVSIAGGLAGDKEKIALFKQLGITTKDLGAGTESVMLKIADAYSTARDGAGKVAVGNALMGKSADEMIPLLNAGGQAIRDLMKEADKLGLTIGQDFAAQAEEFNDNMTRMSMSGQKLAIVLAGDLIESLGNAAKFMATVAIESGKLAGIWAGLQTLITGTDMHKGNVELTHLTEKLVAAEARMDKLRSGRAAKETLDVQAALIKGLKEQINTTQAYRKSIEDQDVAAKSAADKIKKLREEGKVLDAGGGGTKAIKATKELTEAEKDLIYHIEWSRKAFLARHDESVKAAEDEVKAQAEIAKQLQAYADAERALEVELNKRVIGLREEAANYGRLESEIALVTLARMEDQAAAMAAGGESNESLRRQIDAQRELVGLIQSKEVREANEKAAKNAASEWESINKQIGDSFVDNLMNGGKSVAQYLKDLFRTLVLRPILSPIGGVMAAGIGMLPTAANAGGSGLLGTLGTSAIGSNMLGGASMFGQAAGATMQNGMFSGFGANMANIGTLAEGGSIMGTLGAAAPYIALAIAAVALISKLMEGGGPKSDGYSGPLFSSITDTARATGSNPLGATAKTMADAITSQFDAIAGMFGKAGSAQFGVGYTVDPQGDAPTFLEVAAGRNGQQVFSSANWNVGRDDADLQKAFAEAIPAAIFAALKTSDLAKPFQDFFDTIADDASSEVKAAALQTVQDVQRLTVAVDSMGGVFAGFADLSVTARADLIALSGGMEAMGTSLAAMNEALFTDSERNNATLQSIAQVFEDLGLSLPNTNAGFLALVNAQDLTTEAGRQTAAALVGVAGAFGQVTTAIQGATRTALQEIAASLKTMRERAAAAAQGVTDARANIFDAYSEAQGRLNSLLEQSRQATIAFGQTLRQYLASLSLGQFATETPAGQYEALQRRLFETAALARGGNAGARDGLTSAADAFLQSAQDRSTSAVDFAMDRAKVRTLLADVMASIPEGVAGPTLEEQIATAQQEVADYLALMEETGTSTETGVWTVADNIASLRTAYQEAQAEQVAADAALAVAIAALSTLNLSEEAINALLSGATGNSPGDFAMALGVSDETINAIQAAMGFTDAELQALSDALNVSVAPTVFEALAGSLGITPELAEELAWGLGVSPIQMTALSGSLGLSTDAAEMLGRVLTLTPQQRYDLSVALGVEPGQMLALGTALGIDPWLSEHLGYVLGLSGAAQGIIDSLPEAIGIPAGLLPALGSSLGLSPSALAALATITGTTPFTTAPLTDWYAPANGPTIDFGAAGQDLGAFPVQAYMADNSEVVNAVQNMSASLTTQLRKIEQNTEGTNNTLNGIRNGDITVTTEAA